MFVFIESHLHKFSYEHENEMDLTRERETLEKSTQAYYILYDL